MPAISIVIPVFNVEKYLDECLETAVIQDFEDLEIIVVDDASPDNSIAIAEQYAEQDRRLKICHHATNLGLPSARNTGIAASDSKYVFFLDSDDWLAPNAMSVLHDLAESDLADIAIGGILKCSEETCLAVCDNHCAYMKDEFHRKTIFDFPQLASSVISCNKLIKRQFIQDNNLLFPEIPRRFEDTLTYKWYLFGAIVSHTPEITYLYRKSGEKRNSITQQTDFGSLIDRLLAYNEITRYIVQNDHLFSEYDPMHGRHAMMNLPRALAWILPQLFQDNRLYAPENSEHLAMALEVVGDLVSTLPESYSERMKKDAREYFSIFRQLSGEDTEKLVLAVRGFK